MDIPHDQYMYWQTMVDNANTQARYDLATGLNATLSRDGTQYCWRIGETLPDGVAGFGDTAADALEDLWRNFHNEKA